MAAGCFFPKERPVNNRFDLLLPSALRFEVDGAGLLLLLLLLVGAAAAAADVALEGEAPSSPIAASLSNVELVGDDATLAGTGDFFPWLQYRNIINCVSTINAHMQRDFHIDSLSWEVQVRMYKCMYVQYACSSVTDPATLLLLPPMYQESPHDSDVDGEE